jgi:hypothetical protein
VKFDVIMLISYFGASTLSTLASTLILFAMIREINRKRDDGSQIQYFRFSWIHVMREYRLLYPKGRYTPALIGAIFLAAVFAFISLYLLFGVLPRYSVPSR